MLLIKKVQIVLSIKINIMNPLSSNYLKYVGIATNPKQARSGKDVYKTLKTSKPQTEFAQQTKSPVQDPYYQIRADFPLGQPQAYSHLYFIQEGYLFAFLTKAGHIGGKATIIFPEGVTANCSIVNGKLQGWAVLYKKKVFTTIVSFKRGVFQGPQYTQDSKRGLFIQSLYKNGKLHSVVQHRSKDDLTFESFLNNKLLSSLVKQTRRGTFFQQNFPCIKSPLGNFYGSQTEDVPNGLGLLSTQTEIFYGQFERGLLSGQGAMMFENGDFYVGQFQGGFAYGLGTFHTNGSKHFKYRDVSITQEQLKSYCDVQSIEDTVELKVIFRPLMTHFFNIRPHYFQQKPQKRHKTDKDLSVVDIQMTQGHKECQDSDCRSHKSSTYKSHNSRKESLSSVQTDKYQYKHNKNDVINELTGAKERPHKEDNDEEEEEKHINVRQSKKATEQQKTKKKEKRRASQSKKVAISDREWQEVIEELQGQQSVIREDGVLIPNNEDPNQKAEQGVFKHTNLPYRGSRQNIVKLKNGDNTSQYEQKKAINRLVGHILKTK